MYPSIFFRPTAQMANSRRGKRRGLGGIAQSPARPGESRAGAFHPLFIPHPLHLHREGENSGQRAASTASTTNTQHGAQPVPPHASPPSTVTAPRPGCPSLLPRPVALCVVPHCAATQGHRQRQRRRYSGNVARTPDPLPAGHSDNNLNDAGAADADDAHIQ